MHLIDTYPRVLGANMSSIIARRLVGDLDRGDVNWIRARSDEVSPSWTESIDLLFVDGDHAYDAVKRDWKEWSPHVSDDGYVAFHDALVDAPWMNEDFGSARFVHELRHENEAWEIVDRADSLAVFGRRRT